MEDVTVGHTSLCDSIVRGTMVDQKVPDFSVNPSGMPTWSTLSSVLAKALVYSG